MKLNRKGFTLIELLVVVAIMILVVGIAIPTITSSMNRGKEKEKNSKINLIEEAGERYFKEHLNSYTENYISVTTLVTEGYLTNDEIKDPFSDNTLSGGVCREGYQYSENDNC